MSAPNVDDPLDEAVADHWKNDENGAIQRAREWTQQYANNWDGMLKRPEKAEGRSFHMNRRLPR